MSGTTRLELQQSAEARAAPFPLILCAVNGSRCSRFAAAQAVELAGADGAVHFLAITDVAGTGHNQTAQVGRRRAREAVNEAKRLARKCGAVATTEVRHDGEPRRALLTEATVYDLLVIGSHARPRAEGIVTGSTAALALHASAVPVLVARPPVDGARLAERIVVASDGTPRDRHAARIASMIAARGGGSVILVHVQHDETAETRRELARQATDVYCATGAEPVTLTPKGDVLDVVSIAAELDASLLVLGSHSRRGIRALTSVSERVGARARCSTLVLRHGSTGGTHQYKPRAGKVETTDERSRLRP
jgi:nucleotide-binding universal stress UspA family protein